MHRTGGAARRPGRYSGRMRSRLFARALALCAAFLAPALASAHEVYVLTPAEIRYGLAAPPFNEAAFAWADFSQFAFWAFLAALVVFIVFFASIIRPLERRLGPSLAKLRPYAPAISRVTVGLGFLTAAYHQALFGPELPLAGTFAGYEGLVTGALVIIGFFIAFGAYARAAALAAILLFCIEVIAHGVYMLTYVNYLGELLLLLILGANTLAVHTRGNGARRAPEWLRRAEERLAPYGFLILRVAFGISLLYASFYAKILHNNLALQVASLPLAGHPESLAAVFGFEPHFLVLGAAIIEIVIALFFILGIEIRFTSLFLLFWLSLSLWYFGEAVWPHIILIGIPVAFIFYGYDRYSLEGRFFKRRGREPVL